MTQEHCHYLRTRVLALAVGILVSGLGNCGCRGTDQQGSVDDLAIRRYRYNIDEDRGIVRVVGEVENQGKVPVAEVEVRGILRSPSGSKRGENMTVLQNIGPHQRRIFSLTITSHGRTSSVELELAPPPIPP